MAQDFAKAGFSMDQVKDFVPAAMAQLKSVVPPEVVDQIADRVPGLKQML